MTFTLDTQTVFPSHDASSSAFDRLLAKAAELGPRLRERAAWVEQNRTLDPDIVLELKEAGFWKMWRPRRIGGYEMALTEYSEIIGELARYCPSTSWVTQLINGGAWMAGMFPERTQHEFYADGDAYACVSFTASPESRRVDGGWIVSGRWGYQSGSREAQWAIVAITLVDEQGTPFDQAEALVPMSDLGYEETWHVVGMEGTASNTVIAEDLFVPDHRVLTFTQIMTGAIPSEFVDEEPLYRSTFGVTASFNTINPIVGIVQGMLDLVLAKLHRGSPIAYTAYERSIDSPSVQLAVADAAQLIHSARLHMRSVSHMMEAAIQEHRLLTTPERAQIRMDIGYLAQKAREAGQRLMDVSGASAFAKANPLQRQWRDLEVSSRHGIVNVDISREIYSKVILGLDQNVTALL